MKNVENVEIIKIIYNEIIHIYKQLTITILIYA